MNRLRPSTTSFVLVCALLCGLLAGSPSPVGGVADSGQDGSRERSAGIASIRAGSGEGIDNVILITVDTLRWDAVGFSGNSRSRTPSLDRLAASGLVFDNAHAHNVVTLPSHANILTGLYPFQNGIRDNKGFRLADDIPTAATLLRQAGFRTAAVVGAFPLDSRFGLDRGFEVYDDQLPEGSRPTELVPTERSGREVVARGLAWWLEHSGQKRFLWVHLYDPHAPYLPPEPFASQFPMDPYLGEVAAVDTFLAPLLAPHLDGTERSTLIVMTSDHGEALGDHGETTHGLFAYEATLKVPLVLWYPGISARRSDWPAGHVDILPTILETVDVDAPAGLPGRSLWGAGGDPSQVRNYFEALTPTLERGWAPLRGIVGDHVKCISLPIPELYDLTADPGEQHNLFSDERQRAATLAKALPEESEWPPTAAAVDEETAEALRSLGYLGGSAPVKKNYGEADDPKNLVYLDAKMHEFVNLYQQGRLTQAETVARQVITDRFDMSLAHYFLAQVLLAQGRLDDAIEVMQRARAAGVASPALLRQLGMSLAEAGQASQAIPLLESLAKTRDPEALLALGLVLSEAGNQTAARTVLERVFEIDANNPVAHQHLALVALRQQEWGRARDEAQTALELNPDLVLCWNYLGTALYNLQASRDALAAWDRALALEPDNLDVLYNVAVVAMEVGDRDRARRALESFIEVAPPATYGQDIQRARELLRRLGD